MAALERGRGRVGVAGLDDEGPPRAARRGDVAQVVDVPRLVVRRVRHPDHVGRDVVLARPLDALDDGLDGVRLSRRSAAGSRRSRARARTSRGSPGAAPR